MKHLHLLTLCLAVALYCGPAFAQHGHMGAGSTHGAASHDNTNDVNTGSGASHRVTVDQQLSNNTKLVGKIQNLTGMPAQHACDGFKNLGQCVAAAHVAKNLDIPGGFTALKDMMLGISPNGTSTATSKPMSLGKAIQALDPNANSKTEARKGTQQASHDLKNNS